MSNVDCVFWISIHFGTKWKSKVSIRSCLLQSSSLIFLEVLESFQRTPKVVSSIHFWVQQTLIKDSKFLTRRFNIDTLKLTPIRYCYVGSHDVDKELIYFPCSNLTKCAIEKELVSYITCSTRQGLRVQNQLVVLGTVDTEVAPFYFLPLSFPSQLLITVEHQVGYETSTMECTSTTAALHCVHRSANHKVFFTSLIGERYSTISKSSSSQNISI